MKAGPTMSNAIVSDGDGQLDAGVWTEIIAGLGRPAVEPGRDLRRQYTRQDQRPVCRHKTMAAVWLGELRRRRASSAWSVEVDQLPDTVEPDPQTLRQSRSDLGGPVPGRTIASQPALSNAPPVSPVSPMPPSTGSATDLVD